MKPESEREQLIAAVRSSRSDLQRGLEDTREAADITGRVGNSMKRNAIWWIGGSVLAGALLASIGSSGDDSEGEGSGRKAGISVSAMFRSLWKLAGILLTFSSPILKTIATREIINLIGADRE